MSNSLPSDASKKTALAISELTVTHPQVGVLVDNVSLELEQGQILGIVGESGSGKSTTALSVLGFRPPSSTISGRITIKGKTVDSTDAACIREIRRRDVGVVFQDPMASFNPRLTIGAQLREALQDEEHSKLRWREIAIEALSKARVPRPEQRIKQYPHQLSGGLLQRCMIAMALIRNPSILIADEPTTALDVTVQKEILDLLVRLRDESRIAILLISHDLRLVGHYADRIAVMHNGKVVEAGPPSSVLGNPVHPYTKELIAASPQIQTEEELPGEPVDLGEPLLSASNITKAYNVRRGWFSSAQTILNDVNLQVWPGESIGIVGESGSGKSTFARLLIGLEKPDRGTIKLGKAKVLPLSMSRRDLWRRDIHLMFQDSHGSLDPLMTVEMIINEPLTGTKAENRRDVVARLEEVGLSSEYLSRYPSELSGGQRQRVALARALITNPRVLIADEPVSALDVFNQSRIIELIKNIHRKRDFTLILISHDIAVVTSLCDRIAVMKNGQFVEVGSSKQIIYYPNVDYTKDLINASLHAEPK